MFLIVKNNTVYKTLNLMDWHVQQAQLHGWRIISLPGLTAAQEATELVPYIEGKMLRMPAEQLEKPDDTKVSY